MSRVNVLPMGRALISVLAALALLLPSPALAVTYGNPVENPLEKAPYVVSVWASESGDTREAEFICSGTLISSNIILTAAHCTDFENLKFFVKIKTIALMQEAPFYAATPWTGTRYDPGSKVKPPEGDIGLLRINTNITGVKFPSLANSQIAKKINKNTPLILMGWGYDQNRKLADTLRFSKLTLQDARSQKDWSGYFNIKTMISAGKFIKDEKKWSGSCNGDSGGPLLAELSGLTYVVGVTSWGHKQCRTEIPSVFSRVSYYERDIQAGIKAVDLLATSVNRLAPVEVIAPSMKGEGTPGNSLVCDPGTWVNAVSVEINWTSPSRLVGNTNPEAKVIAADIGQEFRCRILAKSKSGNSETTVDRYVSRVLPKKIAVASPPVIGGLEGTQSIKPGTTARCENWNWAEPVDQEVVEWFSSTSSNPSTPVNGKLLGTGREIRLTQELLKSERGRYLVCQLTGTRAGFPSYLIATKLISTADSPIINNVIVTAPSLRNGINASCSFSGTSNAERIQYEWGYSGAGNEFTAFGGQNVDFIRITPQILKQASGQKLACKVTITNLGESVSRVGTSFEVFESELDAPKPSISVSNTPYVGSSASCSIPNSSRYSSVTYSWGITTSPDSGNFISGVLGNFRDLTFDSRILVSSAGNYITCVVTVANEISKAQGIASSKISVSAAPSLPSMSAPYISNQTRVGSQINVSISIPSAFGFDQSTMEAKLRLPGSNCDENVLNSFPSTIVCSGLAGNRDYSVYTEVRYSTNSQIPSRQSSIGTFRTNDATAAPSISLSNATQSVNVNSAISNVNVSNSGGAVSSFSISPSLPIGLTFNSGTGSISGTPSQAQSQRSYTITATNSGGSSSATFTLTVIVAVAAPSIALSNATQSVNANSAISTVNVSNSGGAVNSFSISPSLPSGLTFNSSNGSISGTPTQAQSQSSYTITATNSGGSSSATFTLTVVALVTDRDGPSISTGSTIYYTSTGIVTGTFELVDGSGVASCRATVFNSNNVDVASSTLCSRVSGTAFNGTWQVQIDMQNSAFNPGVYTMKISATDTLGNSRAAQNIGSAFTKPGPSVSNLGSLPTPRTIGINYLDQIVLNSFDFSNIGAAPGNFTWTVRTTSASGVLASSIPIGSNQTYITGLSPSTTYNVVLVATDSAGGTKVSSPLTITTLAPAVAAPSIALSNATQSVNANSAISTVNVSNSGGAVNSFSISPSLPSGLTFNSSNGSISGTPTQAQSQSSYTITATNSGGSSSATFTLTVVAGLVVIPITGGLPVSSTSVGSNVVASFRATDGLGITNAWVRVWNSAENSLQGFGEGTYTANLISGNNLDGTYQATINTSVPGYSNGGTFTVGVQIGGNNRITEWKVIGTFILSVPISTIDAYPLNGVVIGGGRGGTWEFKTFDRASNLLVTAVARSSNGGPNITAARFLKSRSESTNSSYPDEWQATFEVPSGTLNGTVYKIYWTLRNTDGTTREYSGGEFRVG